MTVDHFERFPNRTSKGGGTKCTTCEVTEECHEASKCVYPLLCVSFNMPSCGYDITLVNALQYLGAIRYDCALQAFDLSFVCGGYTIDLLLSYEEVSGTPSAVLRSDFLQIEAVEPFTDAVNARCPGWQFDLGNGESVAVSKYELVSIGQQKCVNSGPDDCTAGRCLPRYLCADVYTVERPDEPYVMQMEWYNNDTVPIDDLACCSGNALPEMLIARVLNFSDGCTCIAPKRAATIYYTAEQAASAIEDPGALLHLRHGIAYSGDAFVTGYPNIPEGSHYWLSEGFLAESLLPLCPAPSQTQTPYTLETYGRLIVWIDAITHQWQACFEIVNYADSVAAGNTDYTIPFNHANIYSNVYRIEEVTILCCSPFQISLSGIVEQDFCQDISSTNGTGVLKIHVGEFQGWTGSNPVDPGKKITLYTERINTASPPQTLPTDCLPKIHIETLQDTFKGRTDRFSVDTIWPDHVYEQTEFAINVPYSSIQRIVIYPRSCTGCNTPPPIDVYGPVQTGCCPNPIPRVLYATAVEVQDCPCATGTVITLIYDDEEEAWSGTGTFGGVSGCANCTVTMRLGCSDLIASEVWKLDWSIAGASTSWVPTVPPDVLFDCEPFMWVTRSVSSPTCCNPSIPAPFFYWVITA